MAAFYMSKLRQYGERANASAGGDATTPLGKPLVIK